MKKMRFGILSTAKIAQKIWKAILQSGNAVVTEVASRDIERSRQFINECQKEMPFEDVPHALGSYEELLASETTDAVYIPLPTGIRKEWIIKAARAGKHIICEKPCAVSFNDLKEMIDACHQNNVQFMDGVMFMHNARLELIQDKLQDQNMGAVKRITSHLSFNCPQNNIRTQAQLEPLGCLGDLGWYCIRFILWAMHWKMPQTITAKLISSTPSDVPLAFSSELFFEKGASASFYCSFQENRRQWSEINYENGYVRVPNFVAPPAPHDNFIEVNESQFPAISYPDTQEANMISHFVNQILSEELNLKWPEIALMTQRVLEDCLKASSSQKVRVNEDHSFIH